MAHAQSEEKQLYEDACKRISNYFEQKLGRRDSLVTGLELLIQQELRCCFQSKLKLRSINLELLANLKDAVSVINQLTKENKEISKLMLFIESKNCNANQKILADQQQQHQLERTELINSYSSEKTKLAEEYKLSLQQMKLQFAKQSKDELSMVQNLSKMQHYKALEKLKTTYETKHAEFIENHNKIINQLSKQVHTKDKQLMKLQNQCSNKEQRYQQTIKEQQASIDQLNSTVASLESKYRVLLKASTGE